MLVAAKTPDCMVCGEWSTVVVDDVDYYNWRDGTLIQVAMPYLNADSCELLMTGTHPECWEEMFSA